jgi:hypothetical protein
MSMLSGYLRQVELIDLSGVTTLTEPGFLSLLNLPKLSIIRARATGITDLAVANLLVALEVREQLLQTTGTSCLACCHRHQHATARSQ